MKIHVMKGRYTMAQEILQLLRDCGGETNEKNLRSLGAEEEALEKAIRYLLGKKWICTESEFFRRTGDKTEKIATLCASAEEAMEYAEDKDGVIPLPTDSDYIDGSWRLSFDKADAEMVREGWNDGQKDEKTEETK